MHLHSRFRQIVFGLFLTTFAVFLYFFSAKLGLQLATINNNASPVWPATGVAMSLLFILGYRFSFAIWIGAFLANSGTGLSLASICLIATGNTAEALIGAYLFSLLLNFGFLRSSVYSSIFRYSIMALVPTMVSAIFGVIALSPSGDLWPRGGLSIWLTWWVGDSLGVLFVFPLVYEFKRWISKQTDLKSFSNISMGTGIKVSLSVMAVYFSSHLVFATTEGRPFLFILFFALLLVAYLLPFLYVYFAALFISGFSIVMTQKGLGPFQSGATNDSLIHLEFFLASVWLTSIVLASFKRTGILRRPAWGFVIGWLLTGVTFYSFYESSSRKEQVHFEAKAGEATDTISETMSGYVRMLEAGAGLINASNEIRRSEWDAFSSRLKLSERYPGIKGIGVIYAMKRSEIAPFTKFWHKEFSSFKVRKLGTSDLNKLDQAFIISLIEPLKQNEAALGLDISSEEHRRLAALKACDTGEAVLSEKISLVQSAKGFGYLLLVPFYENGHLPRTVEERRRRLKGFVYAPIEASTFFSAATKSFTNELKLISYSPDVGGPLNSNVANENELATYANLAGNSHSLVWAKANESLGSTLAASLAGFCGAFCTLILAILVASLEGIRAEAERIAAVKTAEVKERERIWRTLTEISPVGIFLTNEKSEITYVNKKWFSITNISLEDMRLNKLRAAIHPDDEAGVYAAWDEFISGTKDEYIYEYRLYVHEAIRHIACHVVPLHDFDGVLMGCLGIIQDKTDERNNQVALATAARMSSIGQMAGGVAHEINNPLAIISGRAELLKASLMALNHDEHEVANTHIEKIQMTVQRIAKIIRGLRSVARDSSNESGVSFTVQQALRDALDLCETKFLNHQIQLFSSPDIGNNMFVWGRPEQLTQVLLNLLNNSFDAVNDLSEKWVRVECYEMLGQVFIEVSDSGSGISVGHQQQLFSPFFTTKEVGQGTGLGLSISKAIIEKHGGHLRYANERPNTTFIVELRGAVETSELKAV